MMKWTVFALLTVTVFAGCVGDDYEYKPGEGWTETGREVRLLATVKDIIDKEIYPGFNGNMWAFCFKAADPNDAYSVAAVELRADAAVAVGDPVWDGYCSTPGPTLRVNQGDRVIVEFENQHPHPHTIHWHGQYVPWNSDGVPGSTQDSVAKGESFTYDFIAARAGTLWYHCHVDTQFHVMQGLYGVMIVEPQEKNWEPEYDNDQVWVLSTLRRELVQATPASIANPHLKHTGAGCPSTGEQGCQNPAIDITPDVFMINGISAPNTFKRDDTVINLEPGERLRLRMLNAGTTVETIHLHGHDFEVTHIDGNPIPPSARYYVDTLPIAPAQRYDVIIEGREGNEGIWVVHTHVVDHVTNDGQYPGGMLSKIVYPGFEDDLSPFNGVELPGGKPWKPFVTPADVNELWKDTHGLLDVATPYTGEWEFNIPSPCAAKEVRVTVEVDANVAELQDQNDLTLTIKDLLNERDETLNSYVANEEFAMGSSRYVSWSIDPSKIYDTEGKLMHFPLATLTIKLEGQMAPSDVRVEANVIHYSPTDAEAICNSDIH
jgi:plastocyanin